MQWQVHNCLEVRFSFIILAFILPSKGYNWSAAHVSARAVGHAAIFAENVALMVSQQHHCS